MKMRTKIKTATYAREPETPLLDLDSAGLVVRCVCGFLCWKMDDAERAVHNAQRTATAGDTRYKCGCALDPRAGGARDLVLRPGDGTALSEMAGRRRRGCGWVRT